MGGADLCGADLRGAVLHRADLRGAVLACAKGLPPIACPETGSFIGYKKAFIYDPCMMKVPVLVTLRVEEDALRSSATGRKCRCSKVTILSVESTDGGPLACETADIRSFHDHEFCYHVGDTITIPNFDTDRWNECGPGFHFFITKQEAIDYKI